LLVNLGGQYLARHVTFLRRLHQDAEAANICLRRKLHSRAMLNEIALVISSLGAGGLLGVFAKSFLDKRQLKFTKVFDYKESRYKAMSILMLTALNPSDYELAQLKMRRPDIRNVDDLDKELQLEYHNSMLFASDKVLRSFAVFLVEKTVTNYQAVAQAMRKDLYL